MVFRKRKNDVTRTTRAKRPFLRRTTRTPGRFTRRRRRMAPRKAVTSLAALTRNMEQKFVSMSRMNEVSPTAIQVGAQTYAVTTLIGTALPIGWTGTYHPVGGVRIAQGDSNIERDGNVVYMQSTTLHFIIDMKNFTANASDQVKPPHQFRVIVFKSKIKYLEGGTHDPGTRLFLNETNVPFGPQTIGVNGMDLMMFRTNRRDFEVKRDFKFTLALNDVSAHNQGSNSGGVDATQFLIGNNSKYPSQKIMTMFLPHNKKVTYDNSTLEPVDYNPAWTVMILARSQGQDHYANQWEINVRGATRFKDI